MLKPVTVTRQFNYEGKIYLDPNPSATLDEVRTLLAVTTNNPAITTAALEGPVTKGTKLVYTFRSQVGKKG
ncbi:hypothetical protein BH24DEI2_BH24DEI2_24520 [soil metagenome]